MGSFTSALLPDDSEEYYHIPSPQDVYEVRRYLLRFLPLELADQIIDDAQYWPVVSTSVDLNERVVDNNSPLCCLVTPRLDNMILEDSFKVKAVRFLITSHDQGWASEDSFPTRYMGSWTWFEAAIVRSTIQLRESDELGLSSARAISALVKSGGSASHPDISLVKNPGNENDSYIWHIQRNARASKSDEEHEVVWTTDDASQEDDGVVDERELMDKTGAGRGRGFVRSLEKGDRIAVLAYARFPAWTNYIQRVEVQISFSV